MISHLSGRRTASSRRLRFHHFNLGRIQHAQPIALVLLLRLAVLVELHQKGLVVAERLENGARRPTATQLPACSATARCAVCIRARRAPAAISPSSPPSRFPPHHASAISSNQPRSYPPPGSSGPLLTCGRLFPARSFQFQFAATLLSPAPASVSIGPAPAEPDEAERQESHHHEPCSELPGRRAAGQFGRAGRQRQRQRHDRSHVSADRGPAPPIGGPGTVAVGLRPEPEAGHAIAPIHRASDLSWSACPVCGQPDSRGASPRRTTTTAFVPAHHPTDPSRETPISFCVSAMNSIGSCCSTSRTKPLTISATASSSDRPRCWQ